MTSAKKLTEHGVPNLTNSNFDLWLDSLTTCFQALELKKLLKESTKPNERHSDADEGKGLMIIKSTLDDTGRRFIIGVDTVYKAVEKLRGLYGRDETLYQLEGEFNAERWRSDESAEIFVNRLADLRIRMRTLDANITDDRFIRKLIEQAPDSLANVIALYKKDLMLNKPISLTELETVVVKSYRELPKSRDNDKEADDVNASYYNSVPRRKFRKKRPYCKSCRQNGHWTNQCTNNRNHLIQERLEASGGHSGAAGNRQPPQGANVPANGQAFRRKERPPDSRCFMVASEHRPSSDKTYLDSCSDSHVSGDPTIFKNYRPYKQPKPIDAINPGQVLGIGDIEVCGYINGEYTEITLTDALYVPTSEVTLISLNRFENKGCKIEWSTDGKHNYIRLVDEYGCALAARRPVGTNEFYETVFKPKRPRCMYTRAQLHTLLGHACDRRATNTVKVTKGLKLDKEDEPPRAISKNCRVCIKAKMKNRTFNHKLRKETRPGFVLHADVNHMPVESIGRKKYAITYRCEASRFSRVYYTSKLEAPDIKKTLEDCFTDQFADLGYLPIKLHSDNASYFVANEIVDYLRANRVGRPKSTPRKPQQNGIAEKAEQDLTAIARALRIGANLPKKIWTLAMSHACHVYNRTYSETIDMTPCEYYTGEEPDLSHLRDFGEEMWVHDKGDKLDEQSEKMLYVGQADESTVNRLALNLEHTKVVKVTSVTFIDPPAKPNKTSPKKGKPSAERKQHADRALNNHPGNLDLSFFEETEPESESDAESRCEESEQDEMEEAADQLDDLSLIDDDDDLMNSTVISEELSQELAAKQAERSNAGEPTDQVKPQVFEYKILAADVIVPQSIKEVYGNPHEEQWLKAMDDEHLCWLENEVFELVAPIGNEQVLGGHFRYSIKTDGQYVTRFKARYVVDGSEIEEKPDHSPVVSMEAIRALLAWAATNKKHVHTIDFDVAFLNSEMTEEVYTKQMPPYELPDRRNMIYRLKKWSYGLPGSSYQWYATLTNYLIEIGFKQSNIEPCVFFNENSELIVFAYVDDTGMIADELESITVFKEKLGPEYKFKDNGPIKRMLGIDFDYNREEGRLMMSMKDKIAALYHRNENDIPKPNKVPLSSTTNLDLRSPLAKNVFRYRSNVGALNYIATRYRADIAVYVNELAKHMQKPTELHEQLVLRVIAYLHSTINYVMSFEAQPDPKLIVWSDSNFKVTARRCRTGTLVQIGQMPIIWSSKAQSVVAPDNCFAELYAMSVSLNKALYIRNLMVELGAFEKDTPIQMNVDNKAAKVIAETVLGPKSGHYNVNLLYLRDFIHRRELKIEYCKSDENLADLYTKFVCNRLFYLHRAGVKIMNPFVRKSSRKE